jgi:O-antigen ligase
MTPYNKVFFFEKIPFWLTCLLPLLLVTGPFLADSAIIICAIIFLVNSYYNNLGSYYKNNFFYYFLLFYIYINLSSLFSTDIFFSLKSSLPYFRFGIFALSVWYLLDKNEKLLKYFFFCYLLVYFCLLIDATYQYNNRINLFGYPLISERVSSFFGNELIMGSYISRTFPLFLGLFFYLINKKKLKKNFFNIISIIFLYVPILLFFSGERTSFFFYFLSMTYILILSFSKKILYFFFVNILVIFISIFFFESRFSQRIIQATQSQVFKEDIDGTKRNFYIFSEIHEAHIKSALLIFKDNVFLGSGPKTFRINCLKKEYKVSDFSCTSHPHNTYIQLLSEIGLVGFLFVFFVFLLLCYNSIILIYRKYLLRSKTDIIQVSLLSCFLITLWPIVPSGNFFTNWLNIVYYLPVGFYLWIIQKKNKN